MSKEQTDNQDFAVVGSEHGLHRTHNFNAGPAVLPQPVLERARAELLDFHGTGMSILEMSHRSPEFEMVLAQAEASLRSLLEVPSRYKVLFQQGGASLQFAMVPMNLRTVGVSADYIVNGSWGKAALNDAQKTGSARVAATSENTGFDRIPATQSDLFDRQAAYLHYTSNETIHGIEWVEVPQPPDGVPLVCDMSSDFLSKPVEISKYGLIYAGAQKNAGPAGVTVVVIDESLLERSPDELPVMLNYKIQAAAGSMHNTPPCFAIYIVGLVLEWLQAQGGLAEIAARNRLKASYIYQAIDESGGYYRGHAQPTSRSVMNVTFRLPSEELEKEFARSAESNGLIGLKGHRSVGGIRASLYNALPVESVRILAQFMREFQRTNG